MPSKRESQLQLTDIGQESNGNVSEIGWGKQDKLSRTVSVKTSTILAVVAAVVVLFVVVIIAVYFAHPDYGKPEYIDVTSSPVSVVPTTAVPTDVRLPGHLTPIRYDVTIRPDIYSANPDEFSFSGSISMELDVTEATDVITLHYRDLEIQENGITVKSGSQEMTVDSVSTDGAREFYKIHLSEKMTAGTTCKVTIADFKGPLRPDLRGIYYSSYEGSDNKQHYILTSQLQPTDARKVFPCLDEPQLKAVFGITVERKSTHESMSNTVIKSSQVLENNWFADHYKDTPKMSTYILAFIVSDFQCETSAFNETKEVQVCARPNAMNQIEYALNIAGPMQAFFEEYFDIDYPLDRTIHVAVPDFAAGAMENWGLIIYRETALLYDPATASAANKQRVAVVVTHELAHMWFGNLVTPAWWDDIWLNEGFASYMEYTGLNDMYPEWAMEDHFVADAMHPVFALDGLASSHPIYQTVNHPSEISQIFDLITYNKGACVIRMMKFFLGEETFRQGISNYLKAKSYDSAFHDDLFDALSKQAADDGTVIDVKDIMATWIRQMGYPVVTFEYDPASGGVILTQEHFLLNRQQEVTTDSEFDYRWEVPITITTSEDDSLEPEVFWLKRNDDEETLDDPIGSNLDWFVGNTRQRGYYRVNYDDDSWQRLIDQLNSNHTAIHVKNRAQIIDDSFNLGRSGYVDQVLALNATLYLTGEEDLIPWLAAEDTFTYIGRMLALTDHMDTLKDYVKGQISPLFDLLGMEDTSTASHMEQLLRRTAVRIACKYGVEVCQDEAVNLFDEWMEHPENNPVSQNLRNQVYCQAVANGGMEQWEFAREQYAKANSAAEAVALSDAMGCSTNLGALNRFLQMAIEEKEVRRGDFRSVLQAVARNSYGRHLAWGFFQVNYDTIYQRFGSSSFTMSSMVAVITESFSEEYELEDLQEFVDATANKGSAEMAFQQAIENTQINIEWRKQHEENLGAWLADQTQL